MNEREIYKHYGDSVYFMGYLFVFEEVYKLNKKKKKALNIGRLYPTMFTDHIITFL